MQDRRGVLPERQDRGSPAGQNAAQLGQLVFQLQHQGRIALAGGAFRQDIGRKIATRLKGFGTTILAYDPYCTKESIEAFGCVLNFLK